MCVATDTHQNDESNKKDLDIWGKVKKGVYDVKQRTVTTSKNTKESLKIQQAKTRLIERKKAFGVEYLDLMEKDASEEELQACIDKAADDTDKLHEKIERWGKVIAQNKEKMERKLNPNYKSNNPGSNEIESEIDSDDISESESESEEDISIAESMHSTQETEDETEDIDDCHSASETEEAEEGEEVEIPSSLGADRPFDEALAALRQIVESKEARAVKTMDDYRVEEGSDGMVEEAPSYDEAIDEEESPKPESGRFSEEIKLSSEEEKEIEESKSTADDDGEDQPFDEVTVKMANPLQAAEY